MRNRPKSFTSGNDWKFIALISWLFHYLCNVRKNYFFLIKSFMEIGINVCTVFAIYFQNNEIWPFSIIRKMKCLRGHSKSTWTWKGEWMPQMSTLVFKPYLGKMSKLVYGWPIDSLFPCPMLHTYGGQYGTRKLGIRRM